MACIQDGEPDFPKTEWKYNSRGVVPALKFMVTHKRDTLTAITRGACCFYAFFYITYQYYAAFNHLSVRVFDSYYIKALLAHAATSIVRLCFRIRDIELSLDFLVLFMYEDSFQHLIFSAIFLFDFYLTGNPKIGLDSLILSPICIYSFLHFSGYMLSFFYVLGFQWRPIITILKLIVGSKALYVIHLMAFMEVALYIPIILFSLMGLWFHLNSDVWIALSPVFIYPFYLFLRYRSSNNEYGWTLLLHMVFITHFGIRQHILFFKHAVIGLRQYLRERLSSIRDGIRQLLLSVNGRVSQV